MSAPVTFTTGILNPSCFPSEQDRFEGYIAALTGEVTGDIQWEAGTTPPTDTNLYWLKIFPGQSAPQTILKWSVNDGAWVRVCEIPTFGGTSTGAGATYQISNSPPFTQDTTAYEIGKSYTFIANHASTGASTLQIDSLAVKNIKINGSSDTVANTILANQVVTVVYDGTNFQITSTSGVIDINIGDLPPGADGQTLRTRANPTVGAVWETSTYNTPSANYAVVPTTIGNSVQFTHGLQINGNPVVPVAFGTKFVCIEDDTSTGYQVGDEINTFSAWDTDGDSRNQFTTWANNMTINAIRMTSDSPDVFIPNKTNGAPTYLDPAKFKMKAWAIV